MPGIPRVKEWVRNLFTRCVRSSESNGNDESYKTPYISDILMEEVGQDKSYIQASSDPLLDGNGGGDIQQHRGRTIERGTRCGRRPGTPVSCHGGDIIDRRAYRTPEKRKKIHGNWQTARSALRSANQTKKRVTGVQRFGIWYRDAEGDMIHSNDHQATQQRLPIHEEHYSETFAVERGIGCDNHRSSTNRRPKYVWDDFVQFLSEEKCKLPFVIVGIIAMHFALHAFITFLMRREI